MKHYADSGHASAELIAGGRERYGLALITPALTLRSQPIQQALDAARAEQISKDWQDKYKIRAGCRRSPLRSTQSG